MSEQQLGAGSWAGGWNEPGVLFLVLVAGTNGGVFVYDPTAAAGNLIASLTDAATDPFGNVTEKGVSAYVTDINGIHEAVNLNVSNVNGLAGLSIRDTAHLPFAPPGVYGQGSGSGGASKAVVFLDSGLVTNTDTDAVVSAQSQTQSGVAGGSVFIGSGQVILGNTSTAVVNDNTGAITLAQSVATPAGTAGSQLWSSSNGVPSIQTIAGLSGTLPATQTDTSTNTNATASFAAMTKVWSIPAPDMRAGTCYRLTAWGNGVQGSTQQQLNMRLSGLDSATTLLNDMAGATIAASASFHWRYVAEVTCTATGSPGTAIGGGTFTWSQAAATTTGNAATAAFDSSSVAVSTAAGQNMTLQMQWNSIAGTTAPTITCTGSLFERLGA